MSGVSARPSGGTPECQVDDMSSSVHGFSASYVALRSKAEIELAIGLLRRYSPVVEHFTLQLLLQEIIQQRFNFFVLLGDEMRVRLDSNSLHCCTFRRPLSLLQEIIQQIVLIVRFFALEVSRIFRCNKRKLVVIILPEQSHTMWTSMAMVENGYFQILPNS